LRGIKFLEVQIFKIQHYRFYLENPTQFIEKKHEENLLHQISLQLKSYLLQPHTISVYFHTHTHTIPKPWDQDHGFKTMSPKPWERKRTEHT
jgi:hypothetical protein